LFVRLAWMTEWLTFVWVEMLWRFSAENFFSEQLCPNALKKYHHAQAQMFFNGANLPLASATLYSRRACL